VQLLGTDSNGCCCSAGAVGLGLKINEFAYGNPASALRYMECDAELRRSNVQQAPCIGTEVCQFEIVAMPRSRPPTGPPERSSSEHRISRAPTAHPAARPKPSLDHPRRLAVPAALASLTLTHLWSNPPFPTDADADAVARGAGGRQSGDYVRLNGVGWPAVGGLCTA
jgi:hypothetical protein